MEMALDRELSGDGHVPILDDESKGLFQNGKMGTRR
jgi:hypothetical protein